MIGKRSTSINKMVDHLFRHNSGQMVAVLTKIFGFENFDLVEDAIQEALIKALNQWQFKGIPENPKAWMIQVAKNYILDQIRKKQKIDSNGEELLKKLEISSNEYIETKLRFPTELNEDLLCMMFATCHPLLKPDSQIALTLKTVSGFSVPEISRAYLSKTGAVAKMISRAKKTLLKNKIRLQIPSPDQLQNRLDAVLKVLYLMFNEGYSSGHNKELIREELCYEALRLSHILSEHPVTASPKVEALLALFLFQAARLKTRQSTDFLPLAEQERKLWDKKMIYEGLNHFRRSAQGNEVSDYHLEAEIASYHILAKDFDSTDWLRVLECYDRLLERKNSPVVALNRIIVLSKVKGANTALEELNKFNASGQLKNYLPMYIATAQIHFENGMFKEASDSYKEAIKFAENDSIKRFLQEKLSQCKRIR